jgi:hypothetical protein
MKAQLIGAALLAAALAACGGKASFTVGGTIGGLGNQGLVLQNGSDTLTVAAGATSFAFPNSIDYGTEYHVSIKTQPEHMTCVVQNPSGSAGRTTVIQVVITCTQNTYTVGGKVVNLLGDGLVLVNGSSSGTIPIQKGATSFEVFPAIPVGDAYGLSVLTQPSNPAQVCTIANGTGVMGDANRTNVVVTCQ